MKCFETCTRSDHGVDQYFVSPSLGHHAGAVDAHLGAGVLQTPGVATTDPAQRARSQCCGWRCVCPVDVQHAPLRTSRTTVHVPPRLSADSRRLSHTCVALAEAGKVSLPERALRLGIPSKGRMAELTLELLNVRALTTASRGE